MDAFQTALATSTLGTVRLVLILAVGYFASKFPRIEPLLDKETCRCMSRVCTVLFLPALMISSTGATLNPTALQDTWQLIACGSFTIGFSGIVAWLAGLLVFRRAEDRRIFRPVGLSIAFPNAAAFPLLLLDALCDQDYVKSDYNDDSVECFTQASGMIFIFLVVWQVWFYGWGFYALGKDNAMELKLTGSPPATTADDIELSSIRQSFPDDALPRETTERGRNVCHSTGAAYNGAVVVNADRLKEGNSSEGAGAPNFGKDCGSEGLNSWAGLRQRLLLVIVSPNIVAVAIGVAIAMIAPLQKLMFDNPRAILRPLGAAVETIGTPTVAVSTLIMAGSIAQFPTLPTASAATQGEQGDNDTRQTWRRFGITMGLLHVVCRLVVVPAVGFALFWIMRNQSDVLGNNRLMHLVLLVELAMPSASMVIVTLNQVRMPATASFMSQLYLWHYGASILTITAWTALAVHLIY